MTLVEVLLALAILAIAIGAVAQLMSVGTQAAVSAEETAIAQLVAESKMNELASGVAPLEATGLTDHETLEGWQYSVEITPIEEPAGLVSVRVIAQQAEGVGEGVSFELYRWMPQEGFLEIPDELAAEEGAATGSATTGQTLPGSSASGFGSGSAAGGSP